MTRIRVENYQGVFYRIVMRVGRSGTEKMFYVTYKENGKKVEAKAGRQSKGWTAARASAYRARLIERKELTPQAKREAARVAKKAEAERWTINRLWGSYCEVNGHQKSLANEKLKFEKVIRPGIGTKEPKDLVPLDVDRLRMKYQKAGKHTMAARVLELLRRVINFGVKRGLVEPLKFKIEIPKLNNQTTEDLSMEQIEKLMKAIDESDDQTSANVMRLALYTGMRKGEILKLRWTDLDFRRGFIMIRDPKGGTDQSIPMNDAARGVFESIENDTEFVFPGRFGGSLTTCRGVADIAKAADLPPGFRPIHGLRHVYASALASSGQVDMYVLQRLLTHKSPQMTARYAHLRDETLRNASNLAGELLKVKKNNNVKTA